MASKFQNPYKKSSETDEANRRGCRAAVMLLLLLLLLFFLSQLVDIFKFKESHIEGFLPESIAQSNTELKWKPVHEYDVIKGICYMAYELSHVNNRRAEHDSCYAACMGYNVEHSHDLCIGWTTTRSSISGTETCILRSKLDEESKIRSSMCESARLWKSAIRAGKKENKKLKKKNNKGQKLPLPERTETCGLTPFTEKRPQKVFIACMQATGCTLLSYLLGQKNNTAVVLDIGVRQNFPEGEYFEKANTGYPNIDTTVVKSSVKGFYTRRPLGWLSDVRESYQPDYSILFLRHPLDSLLHLATHMGKDFPKGIADDALAKCNILPFSEYSYGLRCGTPIAKLKALNTLFVARADNFARIVLYEDLCTNRESVVSQIRDDGLCIKQSEIEHPATSIIEMMKLGFRYFPSSRQHRKKSNNVFWGAGHLENTFHTVEGLPTQDPFIQCKVKEGLVGLRKELVAASSLPYRGLALKEIASLAKEAAPDIWKYYETETQYQYLSQIPEEAETPIEQPPATPTQPTGTTEPTVENTPVNVAVETGNATDNTVLNDVEEVVMEDTGEGTTL